MKSEAHIRDIENGYLLELQCHGDDQNPSTPPMLYYVKTLQEAIDDIHQWMKETEYVPEEDKMP